ncbi:MAG: omega-amidase [Verrucomicrobiales bacterium]|jgi:omega-amidase
MRLIGLQLDIAWEDKSANHAKVDRLLEPLDQQADLLVLPELFGTGFSMNAASISEATGGQTEQWLSKLAVAHQAAIIGGNVKKDSATTNHFNESLAFSSAGDLLCRYQKIHPFSLGEEHLHYAAGSEVKTFHLGDAVVAPFVCYDLRFPEVFRTASAAGANLMVVIANWPSKRIQHWVTLLQARAIENLCYVIGVNRTGDDPHLEYNGRSIIVDYMGEIVADAGSSECLISADLDFSELNRWREGFPALRDRKF